MLANEMRNQVLLLVDKFFQHASPDYDDASISDILTEAQFRIVSLDEKSFEDSEVVRRNLEQFIKNASISDGTVSKSNSQVGIHPNGVFLDLPDDFFLAKEETAKTAISNEILVKPVKHDFYIKNINNPYKTPNILPGTEVFWRMDISRQTHEQPGQVATSKRTEIITEGTTIVDYRVRYLITPPDIIVDRITESNQRHCILNLAAQYKIVRTAAKILTGATEPEKYQITDKEEKENNF